MCPVNSDLFHSIKHEVPKAFHEHDHDESK